LVPACRIAWPCEDNACLVPADAKLALTQINDGFVDWMSKISTRKQPFSGE
jgi:hypothetical protein